MSVKSPKAIYEYLNRFVAGQDETKKAVSNAMFLHAARSGFAHLKKRKPMKKSNLLIMGPSGCGKTYILEKAAEKLDLPFFKINAKALSNTGYVGTSIESFLCKFKQECKEPAAVFEHAIIIVDEIDKLCLPDSGGNFGSFQKGIQYSLLRIMEGETVSSDKPGGGAPFSTEKMLFVLAGNFEGIRHIREDVRMGSIGFATDGKKKAIQKENLQQELIEYGVVTELVGRISSISEVKPLTKKNMMDILLTTEDSILGQFKDLFEYYDIDIKFTKSDLTKIVNNCVKRKTGARGLQTSLEEYIKKKLFEVEINTENVMKDIREKESPIVSPSAHLPPFHYVDKKPKPVQYNPRPKVVTIRPARKDEDEKDEKPPKDDK